MKGTLERSKGLSLFAAIAFAVGNMVGAGVFVLSGIIVNTAGPSAIFSYLFCGIIVAFSAMSYATLASIFPQSGGGYLYAKRMLGPYPGYLAGWAMYISNTISTAFVLIGFGIYANFIFGTSFDPRLGAILAVILLTALNLRGVSEAGAAEVALVVTKIAILAILIVIGLSRIQMGTMEPFYPQGTGGMIQGIIMVFFAYIGFQVVAQIGGEIRESERTVPLATLVSLVIVAALYTGTTIALLAAHLPSYGSGSVFDAAKVLIGPMGALIVALGAVFSTLSSANANVVGSSRIILTMAAEKQIPGRFARISYGQPANSILFSSVVVLLLIIYGNLTFIVDLTNLTTLATMFLVNVSAFLFIRLEQKKPSGRKFFRLPLGVLIPVLGGVSCILMALTLSPFIIVIGLLFLFGGTALYILEDTPQGNAAIQEIRKILYQRDGNNR